MLQSARVTAFTVSFVTVKLLRGLPKLDNTFVKKKTIAMFWIVFVNSIEQLLAISSKIFLDLFEENDLVVLCVI